MLVPIIIQTVFLTNRIKVYEYNRGYCIKDKTIFDLRQNRMRNSHCECMTVLCFFNVHKELYT